MAWLLVAAVGASWVMLLPSSVSAEGGGRTRNCPPGTPRDPQGYCVLPTAPSKGQGSKAKKSAPQVKRSSKSGVTQKAKSTKSRPHPTPPRDEAHAHDTSTTEDSVETATPAARTMPPHEEPTKRPVEPLHVERPPTPTCSEDEEWSRLLERCISLRPQPAETSSRSTTGPSAEEPEERIEPEEETRQRNPMLFPWVTFGVGLGVSLVGVILDGVAYADYQHTERFNSMEELDDWAAGMEGKAIAGDVLLSLGLATTVAGIVWLVLARRNRDSEDRSRRRFTIGSGYGSEGSFTLQLQGAY